MSNILVSVVIVTKGISEYIKPCLDSVMRQTHHNREVLVINNCADDGFAKELTRIYPNVKIYPQVANLFYAQALNLGISHSKAEFALCLNDDTVLDKNFILNALRGFSIDSRIGMVSGKILRMDRKTIDTTGLFLSPWRTAKERGYGVSDSGKFNKEEYVFGVSGAVAFYRRRMLDDIKIGLDYFDSDFCAFYEDLDIAWRVRNFGWKGYYVPDALAYHARGGTARGKKGVSRKFARRYLNDELNILLIRNRYLTIIKNETLWGFLFYLPFIVLYDIAVFIYLFIFKRILIKKLFSEMGIFGVAFKKKIAMKAKIKAVAISGYNKNEY